MRAGCRADNRAINSPRGVGGLAAEAFRRTAQYDAAIAAYLRDPAGVGRPAGATFPDRQQPAYARVFAPFLGNVRASGARKRKCALGMLSTVDR